MTVLLGVFLPITFGLVGFCAKLVLDRIDTVADEIKQTREDLTGEIRENREEAVKLRDQFGRSSEAWTATALRLEALENLHSLPTTVSMIHRHPQP